ncbi:hypothetical protein SHO565_64380 [Streptomyces sp. HO565]
METAEQSSVDSCELSPLPRCRQRPDFQEDTGVVGLFLHDSDGVPGLAGDRHDGVGQDGDRQIAPYGFTGCSADETGHRREVSECRQEAGRVDPLAAGPAPYGGELVAATVLNRVDDVRHVDRGVESDRGDHLATSD